MKKVRASPYQRLVGAAIVVVVAVVLLLLFSLPFLLLFLLLLLLSLEVWTQKVSTTSDISITIIL